MIASEARSVGAPPRFLPMITDPDVCLRCRLHQCVLVCPTRCYENRPDGRVDLDVARCVSCRACVSICYEFANIGWRPPASYPGS